MGMTHLEQIFHMLGVAVFSKPLVKQRHVRRIADALTHALKLTRFNLGREGSVPVLQGERRGGQRGMQGQTYD